MDTISPDSLGYDLFDPNVEDYSEKEDFIEYIKYLNNLQRRAQTPFDQGIYNIVMTNLHLVDVAYIPYTIKIMIYWQNEQFNEFIMPE